MDTELFELSDQAGNSSKICGFHIKQNKFVRLAGICVAIRNKSSQRGAIESYQFVILMSAKKST